MLFPVGADVFELELIRQMEIQLDGRIRFFMPEYVGELNIHLRSVERRFALGFRNGSPRPCMVSRRIFSPSSHISSLSTYFSLFVRSPSDSR